MTDPNKGAAPPPHDTEASAIVDGGWKLVHHTTRPRGAPSEFIADLSIAREFLRGE